MMLATTGFGFGQKATEKTTGIPLTHYTVQGQLIDTVQKPVQVPVSITRDRLLKFDNESKPSEVKINITNDNSLMFQVNSDFRQGTVVLEIIDPKGDKQCKYTLKTDEDVVIGDKTTTQESVHGSFSKMFRNPMKGDWIIRAIPTAASGNINIRIDLTRKE